MVRKSYKVKSKNKNKQGILMKKFVLLAFAAAASISLSVTTSLAIADDHSEGGPYYAFYHLQVTNPAAVVGAMDKFWASECGKQYPADVALLEEGFNGSNPATHFIINTFQSSADQEKAGEIMRSCPAALEFLQTLNASGAQATTQYMGVAPIDKNDWTQDSVFSNFQIIVEPQNQETYAAAYASMMEKVAKDVDLRSYGLGAVYFGRDQFTHWVWTGASSIQELTSISEQLLAHKAFAEFNQEVGSMRTVVNTAQNIVLKGYNRQ
jgi:hypothetical protein